jgi:hypothetical protein
MARTCRRPHLVAWLWPAQADTGTFMWDKVTSLCCCCPATKSDCLSRRKHLSTASLGGVVVASTGCHPCWHTVGGVRHPSPASAPPIYPLHMRLLVCDRPLPKGWGCGCGRLCWDHHAIDSAIFLVAARPQDSPVGDVVVPALVGTLGKSTQLGMWYAHWCCCPPLDSPCVCEQCVQPSHRRVACVAVVGKACC